MSLAKRLYKPQNLNELFKGPYKVSDSGWIWWVKDLSLLDYSLKLERFLHTKDSKDIKVLKGEGIPEHPNKRYYYKIFNANNKSSNYFVKHGVNIPVIKRIGALFNFDNFLFGRNHLTSECIKTEKFYALSQKYGLPVLALGEYMKFGLPKEQILIQPFLDNYVTFYQYWKNKLAFDDRVQLLIKLIDLLFTLNKLSVCHRDMKSNNILVSNNLREPLKIIDCIGLTFSVPSSLATAVNLGTILYDLNGRRHIVNHKLEELAIELLRHIAFDCPLLPKAIKILPLLLRYNFKKNRSTKRLKLLQLNINIDRLTNMLKKENEGSLRDPNWETFGKKYEQELVNALKVALTHMKQFKNNTKTDGKSTA
jgi:hypothetical protein